MKYLYFNFIIIRFIHFNQNPNFPNFILHSHHHQNKNVNHRVYFDNLNHYNPSNHNFDHKMSNFYKVSFQFYYSHSAVC